MSKFMDEAIKEALRGVKNNHGGPFGAVLVRNGKIISKGHNMVLYTMDPTAHAEMVAIRKASKKLGRFNLSDCAIYTVSEPCPMCMGAILWARIRKVFYGCSMKDARKIGFDDRKFMDIICHKQCKGNIIKRQVGRSQCLRVFDEWYTYPNRKMY
ncbi:MAG: nucleoside deaminase [Candidatus Micrarchaeia archaeon]